MQRAHLATGLRLFQSTMVRRIPKNKTYNFDRFINKRNVYYVPKPTKHCQICFTWQDVATRNMCHCRMHVR